MLKGTTLSIEAVCIKKGARDFSSMGFKIVAGPEPRLYKKCFYAKLREVNKMDADIQIAEYIPKLDFSELPKQRNYDSPSKSNKSYRSCINHITVVINNKKVFCVKSRYKTDTNYCIKEITYRLIDKGSVLLETQNLKSLKEKAVEEFSKRYKANPEEYN